MMTVGQKIAALKALRGEHDQRMRTKAIKIEFGDQTIHGMTPTARDLEARIERLEAEAHMHRMDASVDD